MRVVRMPMSGFPCGNVADQLEWTRPTGQELTPRFSVYLHFSNLHDETVAEA